MTEELLNVIMSDGSRQFGELPQTVLWHELRNHIERLDGAELTDFITDNITEAWIDFSYCGYRFTVNNQLGDYWLIVNDSKCPAEILKTVLAHCALLRGKRRKA